MKKNSIKFYTACFYLCSTLIMFAQGPGSNDEGGTLEGNDADAPIGDYLWVLAALGLVFVYFKFRARQKNSIQG
jgi:hypothetical protein